MPSSKQRRKWASAHDSLDEEAAFITEGVDRRRDCIAARERRAANIARRRDAGYPDEGQQGLFIQTPAKPVITERKSSGWQKDQAAYFGSSVWDGVEPDRTHQKVALAQEPGYTARIDNPDAKALKGDDGKLHLPYRAIRDGKTVKRGTLPWDPNCR